MGRGSDLEQVLEAVAQRRSVVVAGPPGAGRTAVLQEVATSLGPEAVRTVAGLGTQVDRPLVPAAWAAGEWPPASDEAAWLAARLGAAALVCDDLDEADPGTVAAVAALAGGGHVVVAAVRTGRRRTAANALVEQLAAAGAHVVTIGPLGPEDAAALAARLGAAAPEDVAVGSGGYPAGVVALAAGRPLPDDVADEIAAVVDDLSAEAREGLALLALSGRPIAEAVPAVEELADAGLASTATGGGWAPRCSPASERVLAQLDPSRLRSLHRDAARLLGGDPVAVVQHLRAAGDEDAADRVAEGAAVETDDPAIAAALWSAVADRSGSAAHHLAAARAAVRAADGALASAQAARAGDGTAAELVRAQAMRLLGDDVGASANVPDGDEPEVIAERARLRAATAWDRVDGVRLGGPSPAGVLALAVDGLVAGDPRSFEAVVGAARAAHDRDVELTGLAAQTVLAVLSGTVAVARSSVAELAGRVSQVDAPAWASAPGWLSGWVALHADGDPRPLLDHALGGMPLGPLAAANVAYALGHVGRIGEATALLDETAWPSTPVAEALRWWAAAEVAEAGGRATTCATAARRCAEVAPAGLPAVALASLAAARAALDAGRGLDDQPVAAGSPLLADPVAAERRALERADAEAYTVAADAWAGRMAMAELRCRWAAADRAVSAGGSAAAVAVAVDALEALEARATDLGLHPLLARVRRSLRAAGVRRTTTASAREGLLSPREREVLLLVRDGLASPEIAARLGVARSTVESQVKSAVRKLGAKTRLHAAAMVAEVAG